MAQLMLNCNIYLVFNPHTSHKFTFKPSQCDCDPSPLAKNF